MYLSYIFHSIFHMLDYFHISVCLIKLSKILDKICTRSVNNSLIPHKVSDTLCTV